MEREPGNHYSITNKDRNYALTNARIELKMSMEDIAKEFGIHPTTWGTYENKRHIPPEDLQKKIIDFFNSKGLIIYERELFKRMDLKDKISTGGLLNFEF